MAEPVALSDMKVHLRLGSAASPEDGLIESLIVTARRAVEQRTSRTIIGNAPTLTGDDLVQACHAIKLLVTTWYVNREGDVAEPPQVAWLLGPLVKWDDGACEANP